MEKENSFDDDFHNHVHLTSRLPAVRTGSLPLQSTTTTKTTTLLTRSPTMTSSSQVTFHVECEMIGSAECALAHGAFEGSVPGVLPIVACQLVGAREPPTATAPRTMVRFLACMSSHMCFKMRTFRVSFSAAGVFTGVDRRLPSRPVLASSFHFFLFHPASIRSRYSCCKMLLWRC